MILGILDGLGDIFLEMFYKILWGLINGVLCLLDGIQQGFFFLTGVQAVKIKIGNGKEVYATFLELIFGINWGDDPTKPVFNVDFDLPIHRVFIALFGVFVLAFVFCIICAIIKINMNRQDQEALPSTRKMFYKSIQAFFVTLLLPIIFSILLCFSGLFVEKIIDIISDNLLGAGETSIADVIFKACLSEEAIAFKTDVEPDFYFKWWKEQEDNGWKIGYEWLELQSEFGSENPIDLFTITIASAACLVGIGLSALTVAERVINIVLLYFIAPFVCASIPLDDGKRWESWKDITTVKILTAAANIFSIFVFLYLIIYIGNDLLEQNVDWGLKVAFLLIIVAGAFCCAKASTLIASIISANQGQQEGMSFAATRALSSATLKLAGGMAGVAGLLAFGSAKNRKQAQTNTNNNNSGGGNDEPGQDTDYTPDSSNPADTFNNSKKMRNSSGGGNDSGSGSGNTGLDSVKNLAMGAGLGGVLSTAPTGNSTSDNSSSQEDSKSNTPGGNDNGKTAGGFKGFKKAMDDVKKGIGKVTNPTKKAIKKAGEKISQNGIIGGSAKVVMGAALALAGGAAVAAIGGVVFGGRKLAQSRKAKQEEKQRLAQEKQEQEQKLAQERTNAGLNPIDNKEMDRRGINIENPRERVNVDNVNQKREAVWNAKQESKDALTKYPEKLDEANKKYDEASKNYYDLKEKKARGEKVSENELKEAQSKLRDAGLARHKVQSQPGMALQKQKEAEKKLENAEKKLDNVVNKNTKTDLIENKDVEKSLEAKEPKIKGKKTSNDEGLNKPEQTGGKDQSQEQKNEKGGSDSSNKKEGTANTQTNQPKNEGLNKPGQTGGKDQSQEQKNEKGGSDSSNKKEGTANTQTNQPKNEGLNKPGQTGGKDQSQEQKNEKGGSDSSNKKEGTANTQTNQPKNEGLNKPGQTGGEKQPQGQKNEKGGSDSSNKKEGTANTQTNQPKNEGLNKPGQSGGSQNDLNEKSKKFKKNNDKEETDEKEDKK